MILKYLRLGSTLVAALFSLRVALYPMLVHAGEVTIEVNRDGDFITVEASAALEADARTAWAVLTDYNHLAEFIPDMKSSRVLRREAGRIVVEQKGELGFLFFSRAVDVTMSVSEHPPQRIVAHAVAGNLKDMEASYLLTPAGDHMRLGYSGRFVPDFFLPPFFGMPIVRRALERRLQAMVDEIERRYAASRGSAKPARAN